jgi:hypothetical protein
MKGIYKLLILGTIFFSSGIVWAGEAILETIGGAEQVSVKRAGQDVKLKKGDALKIGDELITDKSTVVDIRLSDDKTLIRVGANSSYRLEEESKGFFHRLLTGVVRVLVPPTKDAKAGSVRFKMNTPEGTIGVRGTEFVVIRNGEETTLRGLEGTVMFGPLGANFSDEKSFEMVSRGFMSTVKKGSKPGKPHSFPLGKYLKEIDSKNGIFGALADRKGNMMRSRSAVGASQAPAPVMAKAEVPKIKSLGSQLKVAKPNDKPMDDNAALFLAASVGDVEKAKALIKKGADVNSRHADGARPLHAAVVNEKHDMVTFLLENGADVNAKNNSGETALIMIAFETGNAATALILTEAYKADVKLKNRGGFNALEVARFKLGEQKDEDGKKKYEELVKLLEEEMGQ